MELVVELVIAAAPALLFLALPFLASAAGAVFCAAVHRQLKQHDVHHDGAGTWLSDRVHDLGFSKQNVGPAGLEVGVAPAIAGSADGYWPALGYIGLAPRTWVDRTQAGRAIASHELGHAVLWMRHPRFAAKLGAARRVAEGAFLVAGAGFLVGGLLEHAFSVGIGFFALGLGLAAQLGVLWDEANASRTGATLLAQEGLRSRGTDLAMGAAFFVYALPFLIRLVFLLGAPTFAAWLLEPQGLQPTNSPLALWSVLLLFPLLILRALQVAWEFRTPVPRANAFQLNWTLYREHAWAFHSGSIVLIWLALGHDEPLAAGTGVLFLLAILPAMRPLGGLGRLVVLTPLLTVLTLIGFTGSEVRYRTPPEPDPLRFLPNEDHLFARLGGLLRIAWLPLALVLVRRAISGW